MRRHGFIAAFCLIYLVIGVATLSGYGLTWDAWELYCGDKSYEFWTRLSFSALDYHADDIRIYDRPDHPDFHGVTVSHPQADPLTRPWFSWPVGPLSSSITKHLLWGTLGVDALDAHHCAVVLYAAALLALLHWFAQRHIGSRAAVAAVVIVAVYPRFWAHAHNNLKDVPSTFWFVAVLVTFAHGLLRDRARLLWLSAVCWGIALATKANAWFLPFILGPWFVWVVGARVRQRRRAMTRGMAVSCVAYPFVGVAVMLACWPLLWMDFPAILIEHVRSLFYRGYQGGGGGWNATPVKYALYTMPPGVLIFALLGILAIARQRTIDPVTVLLCLWASVPLLRVTLPGTVDFDGIRHWIEFVPAVALIAGLAFQRIHDKARDERARGRRWSARAATLLGLGGLAVIVVPTVLWNVRNHPHQICYFNSLAGGLSGAQRRVPEATDYWGSSYRQGMAWMNEHAPAGSTLVVGVAEHLVAYSRQIRLDDDIHWQPILGLSAEEVDALAAQAKVGFYLMYITRPRGYHPVVPAHDGVEQPVYSIVVDGFPILKILRLG